MEDECIHDLEFGCTICSGKDAKPKEQVDFEYWAKYDGHCSECDLPVMIGQRCAKTTYGRNVHKGCVK